MSDNKKRVISIVTPCFNEEENIAVLVDRIRAVFDKLPAYEYEHIFIDNASTDSTVRLIKAIAKDDHRVKLIVNSRNFGHIRSPAHGFLQASGDCVVMMTSDLQDPPELISKFVQKWEEGYPIVIGVKPKSRESPALFLVRRLYYSAVRRIADIKLIPSFSGFGLYDRRVVELVRTMDDPYPYFRGIIADIGLDHAEIEFEQPKRIKGLSKNNFYTLYDIAMLGITSYSKIPLRLATMLGFMLAILSLLVAFGYFVYKLLYWSSFSVGMAPLVIGLFFFGAVQMFFIGILGEYIGAILTNIKKRPLVIERERINFDSGSPHE